MIGVRRRMRMQESLIDTEVRKEGKERKEEEENSISVKLTG